MSLKYMFVCLNRVDDLLLLLNPFEIQCLGLQISVSGIDV